MRLSPQDIDRIIREEREEEDARGGLLRSDIQSSFPLNVVVTSENWNHRHGWQPTLDVIETYGDS